MTSDWIAEAKRLPVTQAAQALGLTLSKDRFGPCPACKAASRAGEKRPPVHEQRGTNRWVCNACHVTGDVIDLVSWVLLDRPGTEAGARFAEIRRWFEVRSAAPAVVPVEQHRELRRIPRDELARVLRASTSAHLSTRSDVQAWLQRRALQGVVPAWVLPSSDWVGWRGLSWWPAPWADRWPIAVPAYTGLGEIAGLHARAIAPDQERRQKTTWARGVDAAGLVFADPWRALPALRGDWSGVKALVLLEGVTDFLSGAGDAHALPERGIAVLGIESGSASAVGLLRGLPAAVQVFIGTHADDAGDRYFAALQLQLATTQKRFDAYRLPLGLAPRRTGEAA